MSRKTTCGENPETSGNASSHLREPTPRQQPSLTVTIAPRSLNAKDL